MESCEIQGLAFVRSQIALGGVRKSVKLGEPFGSRGSAAKELGFKKLR